jgi:hypothetical protein
MLYRVLSFAVTFVIGLGCASLFGLHRVKENADPGCHTYRNFEQVWPDSINLPRGCYSYLEADYTVSKDLPRVFCDHGLSVEERNQIDKYMGNIYGAGAQYDVNAPADLGTLRKARRTFLRRLR